MFIIASYFIELVALTSLLGSLVTPLRDQDATSCSLIISGYETRLKDLFDLNEVSVTGLF